LVCLPQEIRHEAVPAFRTADAALDEMMNTWLPHQIIAGRLWGRTGHYQCGGAYGFRDQLQDVTALLTTQPELAKQQIARCAAAQFPEGDALHWWHRLPGQATRGVRTRYADDYLWLPYVTSEYIRATGDRAFLHMKLPFRSGAVLAPEETERYAEYPLGNETASLLEHCTRSADRALDLLGSHGLPLMQGGDWNDGMNRIGIKGRGESVWLGMFLSMVLDGMELLCDCEAAAHYRAQATRLREAIDTHAWAGDRWLRAFRDDGTPLNGIDLLPQAFAALCGMPNKNRVEQGLCTAMKLLVDREHGLIRLLREPFDHRGPRAGYINDYPPGVRENGGQYTHAAVWFVMALFRAGRTEDAHALLCMLNPAQVCQDPACMARYQAEPYFLAGDVSAAPGIEGRAGWSLYTGSAAWFWRCVAEEFMKTHSATSDDSSI
jgi:cyclic beta-1,2-glucan synthetase